MGDAHNTKPPRNRAEMVALLVRPNAHVDIADLDYGQVTKAVPLLVEKSVAAVLLERHPYLMSDKGQA